jgi:hypothetical protein
MRVLPRLLAILFLSAASACAEDDPLFVPTDENVVGTYALFLANGGGLPFVVAADGVQRVHVVSGHITLESGGGISDELLFRVSRVDGTEDPSDITEARSGTYVREGSVIFASFEGEETPTRIDISNGPQLTRSVSNLVLSYKR